jgi:hypothetical protein
MFGMGAKPAWEIMPNRWGKFECEDLQDTEGNGIEVNKAFKRFHFLLDNLGFEAVFFLGK